MAGHPHNHPVQWFWDAHWGWYRPWTCSFCGQEVPPWHACEPAKEAISNLKKQLAWDPQYLSDKVRAAKEKK